MIDLDLQIATQHAVPQEQDFQRWVKTALADRAEIELTIRLVDEVESQELNTRYRNKAGPTNVLSFPAELPDELELPLLGDIVICAPLVDREAAAQGKRALDHWAHLTIHGVLHLVGYDHQQQAEADEMEALETELLASLGIPNPYE